MIDQAAGIFKRLDRALERRSWAPTAEGLLWIILTLLILVQGLARGFNLVIFIATFLLAMWLINMLATLLSGRRLKRLLARRRLLGLVNVGTPVMASLEIENPGYNRNHGLRLFDSGSDHAHRFGISQMEPFQTQELKFQIVPRRRGIYRWQPLKLSTAYPFGLARRLVVCPTQERETIVHPMLGQLDVNQFQRWLRHSQRVASLQTRTRSRRSVAPADFYGIRNYRPGDSPRWIHWRTTARVGIPMVREFEEPPQDHITVIVEAWLPAEEAAIQSQWKQDFRKQAKTQRRHAKHVADEKAADLAVQSAQDGANSVPLDLVEQVISLAATLSHTWTRKLGSNITLGVIDGATGTLPTLVESGPTMRQLLPLMDRLAQTQATAAPNVTQLIRELQHTSIGNGSILFLSTRNSPLADVISKALNKRVQLLDMSQHHVVKGFFTTQARAVMA
jgi:hypothetical protein